MIYRITASTAPEALYELFVTMPGVSKMQDTRNGYAYVVPYPSLLTIYDPTARVVFDPLRDANPFLHCMEFIWMMAGRDNVEWPAKFAHNYEDYAEDDGHVHGAYGRRWRSHFHTDQILDVIQLLMDNPQDRQVVIGMWDPDVDLNSRRRDKPCNTHIYLRADNGVLDMTVCSRSNDAIWGMLGANVVHMTMLQEFISVATKIPLGNYYVFANNLHIYPDLVKNFTKLWSHPVKHDYYNPDHREEPYVTSTQVLLPNEDPLGFLRACEGFILNPSLNHEYYFLDNVAKPMYKVWDAKSTARCDDIQAPDWKLACQQWLHRHRNVV